MTEQSAKQEILQVKGGCVHTRGEHDLEDGCGEDSCSDYVSAESDAEDDEMKLISVENDKKDDIVSSSSSGEIKRPFQPKSIVIPSTKELEIAENNIDNCTFVPTHPGLPVMPSVPPQSPQEKAQLAAREGKVRKFLFVSVYCTQITVATHCQYWSQ